MDLTYTEDQAAYRDAVQRFADRVLRPLVEKYDFTRPLDRGDVAAMRAHVAGHDIASTAPLLDDGSLDLICLGIFIEEITRINSGFASLANALFFQVWNMIELLDDKQREMYGWLFEPGMNIAMGMSEPNAGSNPSQIETVARRKDGGWVIDGHKMWTSHALVSAGILVAARKVEEEGKPVSLFLLNERDQSYEVRDIPCMGMDAVTTCSVDFDACWVPEEAELTPGKGGLKSALKLVEQARIKLIFMAVGVSQASLDLAVEYAKVRPQFGRPIGSFQLVQAMLAEMATLTSASRLLSYQAASLMMAGKPARAEVSMAKAFATESAVRVTSLGIQVHGAIGLTRECGAEQLFRDARMLTIPNGTTQIHELVIGRELTGLSAFI